MQKRTLITPGMPTWRRALAQGIGAVPPMGGAQFGTISALDSLASSQQSIAQYGEDRAFAEIQAALAAHNRLTDEVIATLTERSSDRQRRYGSQDSMAMEELDEFGRPAAQKITAGATVGFPLRLYGIGLQWTRTAFMVMTAAEMAAQTTAAMDADVRALQREVKKALFTPTNYTWNDIRVDNVQLAVKALVNADGAAIPLGPNGEVFVAGSHTHYNFTASTTLAAADLVALIEDVAEHYASGQVVVDINRAQEAAVRGLTGFTAYLDARLIGANNAQQAAGALSEQNLYDRAIGVFSSGGVTAEIVVKPWVPAGYLLAYISGGPRPLVLRERQPGSSNFVLAFEDEAHPLRARAYEREYGVGVWNRTAAAVLYIDTGAAGAYVAPVITA